MTKILVVDDSRTSRMLFRAHMPKDEPFELCEAADAADAVQQGLSCVPDLVVMDYNMPAKNGVEIGRDLIAAGVKARYVLLTANTQKAVVEAAKQAGFASVVQKPVTTDKLRDMLRDLR